MIYECCLFQLLINICQTKINSKWCCSKNVIHSFYRRDTLKYKLYLWDYLKIVIIKGIENVLPLCKLTSNSKHNPDSTKI